MRSSKTFAARRAAAVVLALALPTLSGIAAAQTEVSIGTNLVEFATIPQGEWKAYSVAMQGGDSLTYSVTVTSGSRIDVYFLDDGNYALYKDRFAPSFEFYSQESEENTMSVAGFFRPGRSDTFWVVVDNVNLTTTGATASGEVTVNVSFTKAADLLGSFLVLGLIVLVAVIAVIVVVVYLVTRKGKEPPTPAAPPPYAPGPPGEQVPPVPQPPPEPPRSPPSG